MEADKIKDDMMNLDSNGSSLAQSGRNLGALNDLESHPLQYPREGDDEYGGR